MDEQAWPWPTHVDAVPVTSQQSLVLQLSPAQHDSPGLPHGSHVVPRHTVVVLQAEPAPTHVCVDGLQHPPLHTLPEQHAWPV